MDGTSRTGGARTEMGTSPTSSTTTTVDSCHTWHMTKSCRDPTGECHRLFTGNTLVKCTNDRFYTAASAASVSVDKVTLRAGPLEALPSVDGSLLSNRIPTSCAPTVTMISDTAPAAICAVSGSARPAVLASYLSSAFYMISSSLTRQITKYTSLGCKECYSASFRLLPVYIWFRG
jgi:hypothetical protein